MQLSISKWGNSLALRLPRHLVREARLAEGAKVTLETRDGSLVVTPVRKKFKLSELLADYNKSESAEVDWGKQEGDEAW
ncbi:AbrB/MazE/SpoVT family DNA-binding domain-containing protein [Abyssibius alkaniclasticus]|uniref:AbrB/MazE/SpoVT family DNA-binding domain-containing protein n=1 Tax=Abyssibius alkaniclasticus TaxID=2881234 RepID=UPI002363BD6E|nr:AbrB/MazE/SpoVT family DNA-binding domain-containing protein [Abyssibius alkaniclasticus]UPH71662.1 AbrB/MazE/SpoVT family DNA-binding domain-containing protein [Abyssibius alkaniclasticus]